MVTGLQTALLLLLTCLLDAATTAMASDHQPAPPPPADAPPLQIAILLNSYNSKFLPAIEASYTRALSAADPTATLTFFEPANAHLSRHPVLPPDPSIYDLVVLGGANVDPRKSHPWILRLHDFLASLLDRRPDTKLLAICWGHQTVARLLGGAVADLPVPEMGVSAVTLTEAGRRFFPLATTKARGESGRIFLQQHHRRHVVRAGKGFVPLAEGNQVLINERGTVLTMQGHPEKDAATARLRMHDSARWFGFDAGGDEKAWAALEMRIEAPHDGEMVWRRILEWVREPVAGVCPGGSARELKM